MTLTDATIYLVSPARIAAGEVAAMLPDLAAAGVGIYQLRESDKGLEARDLIERALPIRDACRAAGIPFVVNDRPDVAVACEADGVHVGQRDVPPEVARSIVGGGLVGLSTHTPDEVERAVELGDVLDYIAVGPVNATPTKPGRAGTGTDLVRHAASVIPPEMPWFVTGGMSPQTIPAVVEQGASRVVVVRAIADAAEPIAATASIAAVLSLSG